MDEIAMDRTLAMSLSPVRKILIPKKRSEEFSRVSVPRKGFKSFRYILFSLISLSIGVNTIENGLNPIVLAFLPLIFFALNRRNYADPFIWSEKTGTILFFLYIPIVALIAPLQNYYLPSFLQYFTFGLLLVRAFSPLTDRNIWQLVFLSLGLIIINCIFTNHISFGLLLPVYISLLMGVLTLFHIARSRFQGGFDEHASSIPNSLYLKLVSSAFFVLIFTVILFVVLPRPFVTMPGLQAAMSNAGGLGRLDQKITYRDMVNMPGLRRIAFAVNEVKGNLPESPYFRGRVLERTDGYSWQAASNVRSAALGLSTNAKFVYSISPYRLQSNVVYAFGTPAWAKGRGGRPLSINGEGEIVVDSAFLFSDSYQVGTNLSPIRATSKRVDLNRSRDGITPKIEALAKQWSSGVSNPKEQALTLASRLKSQYKYSLQVEPPPEGVHPIENFLFETRSGHCEYFAGALTLMLRSLNIPARVVEGFAGMEPTDNPGEFLVRFSKAHAWVEAVLDNQTWTTLDPTPASRDIAERRWVRYLTDWYDSLEHNWIKYVVYFDRADQLELLKNFGSLSWLSVETLVSFPKEYSKYMKLIAPATILICIPLLAFYFRKKSDLDPGHPYRATMNYLRRRRFILETDTWHERNRDQIKLNPELVPCYEKFNEAYLRMRFDAEFGNKREFQAARKELLRACSRLRLSARTR